MWFSSSFMEIEGISNKTMFLSGYLNAIPNLISKDNI